MALFSPSLPSSHLPTLSTTFSSKPHASLKLPHFHFISKRNLGLLSRKVSENGEASVGSAVAAVAVEEVEKEKASLGSNGTAHVAVKEPPKFGDPRWVGETWDLKQFEKDGKTNWVSVIDAGVGLFCNCCGGRSYHIEKLKEKVNKESSRETIMMQQELEQLCA